MQQERDSETHRARLAESRFAALKDKTSKYRSISRSLPLLIGRIIDKLQAEVGRLQDSLEEKRLYRLESSESIIQDARSRIESVRKSVSSTQRITVYFSTSYITSRRYSNGPRRRAYQSPGISG